MVRLLSSGYSGEKVQLQVIPLDLVGFQMEVKAGGIGEDGGVLGNIGVVDHAVFAVGYESVDFHIVVGGVPLMQDLFTVGSPQNGAVQHTAVFEGVRQTGDVDAAAVAEAVHSHLDFLVLLNQNVGAFVSIDALLAFAEVHLTGNIFQDEVAGLFFPVVLVVVQGEAGFLLNAQNLGQLQEMALILVAGGLTDTDETAAIVDELADSCGNCGIFPFGAAGVGSVSIANVDDDVNVIQNGSIAPDIVEGDKLYIEGSAGQGLDDAWSTMPCTRSRTTPTQASSRPCPALPSMMPA